MQITADYLEQFAVAPTEPAEITLNEWEMPATAAISLDDDDGHSVGVIHWDGWPSQRPWEIRPGTENRWTFATLQKGISPVGGIGYEFAGLISLSDLRDWFRAKLGIADAPEAPAED